MGSASGEDLVRLANSDEFKSEFTKVKRWDILPTLFRVKGKPFSLDGREPFRVLFDKEMVRETIILSGRQLGKCQMRSKKDDPLALRDNLGRRIDTTLDIPSFDRVSSESWSRSVTGDVSAHMSPGVKPIIEIRTALGRTLRVTEDHRVRVFGGYSRAGDLSVGSRVMTMRKCYEFGTMNESEYRIALTAYLVGGGCCGLGGGSFEITGNKAVAEHVIRLCSNDELRATTHAARPGIWRLDFRRCARIRCFMAEDGLSGKYSCDKHIPDWVFALDRDGTRLFLECLWATGGSVKKDRRGLAEIAYCSTSPLLASDVRALLSKFGIATSLRVKKSGHRDKAGEHHICRDAFIVRVHGYRSQKTFLDTLNVPGKPSFKIHPSHAGQDDRGDRGNRDTLPVEGNELIWRLAAYVEDPLRPGRNERGRGLNSVFNKVGSEVRRKPKYPISRFKLNKYIEAFRLLCLDDKPEFIELQAFAEGDAMYDKVVSIKRIGVFPTFDIEVAGAHNFVSDNICVHNSMSLSRSEIFDLMSIPNFQILYVAPLQEQSRRYSDLYINEAIQSCTLAQRLQNSGLTGVLSDAKIIKATGHQTFANGSGIQLTYAKTSADRVRGVTADRIDFDEVQDQSPDAMPIIQESLTSSSYGCSRYTGTAKVVENLIEAKWQKSSMCEWVMKCSGCGHHNIPNMDGKVLQMIQADGMHCVRCGKKLNVRDGTWVAAYPSRMKSFRGYHIPQVVCPFIVEDRNNWDKLLHKLMNGVLATFIQENLGISYSVGQRLLTQADIVRQSCLPDMRTLQERLDRYSYTVMGVDWGGAELQSFTVATVVGIRPDGRIDCLYAKRYRGFDPDEQLVDIAKVSRYYDAKVVAADLGMGMDKNLMLVRRFGLPVVQMMYTRQHKLFGKNKSAGATNRVSCWTIDKVMALDMLFLAIKNGRIFFPKTGMESFEPDLLSPYETTTEVGGIEHRLYLRSEGQPDDFCHALCFACMAAMRLMGLSVDDMVPSTAFGGGIVSGRPTDNFINPYED